MLKEADQILVEMIKKALSPNSVTYNTIISGHCREDGIEQALVPQEEMVAKGLLPDSYIFSVIIYGLYQRG